MRLLMYSCLLTLSINSMAQDSIALVKEELGPPETKDVTNFEVNPETKDVTSLEAKQEAKSEVMDEVLSDKTEDKNKGDDDVVNNKDDVDATEPKMMVENPNESTENNAVPMLELNIPTYKESAYSQDKKWGVSARYLGILSQVGVERELFGQISMGLYYGRYQGKVAGSDDLGLIPDLDHVALQVNAYLGEQKSALSTGPVLRFAVHGNKQKSNALVKSVQVDGVDVIVPGKTRVGTLLGVGYHWQWNPISLSVGIEYLSLGPLKNLVPLAASLGVAF